MYTSPLANAKYDLSIMHDASRHSCSLLTQLTFGASLVIVILDFWLRVGERLEIWPTRQITQHFGTLFSPDCDVRSHGKGVVVFHAAI